MTQDTKLQQLVINKLTTAQYQAALNAGTIDPNQLYMTTDSQTLRDVTVDGSSIVSNNTVALGTMALETASNYSTKAVADTLYAQKALETTITTKVDKVNSVSKLYGTDAQGNQTTYNVSDLDNTVEDVRIDGVSIVASKVANFGTMAGETASNYYTKTDVYNKTEIDGKLSAGMHYKGTVASYENLPASGQVIGDLYNVTDTGANYAWNGTTWDKMSENIDLSGYVPTSRTINGKALNTNITLTAADVNALPSSTVIPTVNNASLTIQKNGTDVQTFTANASSNVTANITVPTTVAELSDASDYVTLSTTQNITGEKTFIGPKRIKFKQSNSSDKLGFTLYNTGSGSNSEVGAFEYNNSSKVDSKAILVLNSNGNTLLGFRYWGSGSSNILAGVPSTAGNYYIPIKLTNGTTSVTADKNGIVNISTLIPDALPSQSGNSGKFLTTNGTTASWATVSQPSIATTSTAGLVKPDGTTITIDSNGTISSAGGVDIDEKTITENSDNEIQTVGVIDSRDNTTAIKTWTGTKEEYDTLSNNFSWTKTQNNTIGNINWENIAYDGNTYVALSQYGDITTSSDGITWTTPTYIENLGNDRHWCSITYGNGMFVAISIWGYVSTSTNGTTWTEAEELLYYDGEWTTIIFDGNRFIAIGNYGCIDSLDGETWGITENITYPPTYSNSYFAYANGKYVTLNNYGYTSSSSNCINWTEEHYDEQLENYQWSSLVSNGSKFIAISSDGYISTSSDGTTWTEPVQYTNSYAQIYDGNRYIGLKSGYVHIGLTDINNNTLYNVKNVGLYLGNNRISSLANEGSLSIYQGSTSKGTFNANSSSDVRINLDGNDNKSITNNSSNEMQTVGVIDSRDNTTAIKTWTGTKAQYDTLSSITIGSAFEVSNLKISSGAYQWSAFAYGDNKFIVLGSSGYISTSTNGYTWSKATQNSTLSYANTIFSLKYGNDKFVALTNGGKITTSTNGTSWSSLTTVSNLSGHTWYGLEYDGSKFVAISSDGYISTSTNGTSWSASIYDKNLGNNFWVSLVYDGGKFVALGNTGYISTSTNGTSWSVAYQNSDLGNNNWVGIEIKNGAYVAIGGRGYISRGSINSNISTNTLYNVIGSGLYLSGDKIAELSSTDIDNNSIVSNGSGEIQTVGVIDSRDNTTAIKIWTGTRKQYDEIIKYTFSSTVDTSLSNYGWNDIAYGSNNFVILGYNGFVSRSSNGTNWSTPSRSLSNQTSWTSLTYDGTKFIALHSNGMIATSTNGSIWSSATTVSNLGSSHNWKSIAYGNNLYVALGSGGYVSTSTDGTTWEVSSQNSELNGMEALKIAYCNGIFTAMSTTGYTSTSTDGVTWSTPTRDKNLSQNSWLELISTGTNFIIYGSGGYVSTSYNGTKWTPVIQYPMLNSNYYAYLGYGNRTLIAVTSIDSFTVNAHNNLIDNMLYNVLGDGLYLGDIPISLNNDEVEIDIEELTDSEIEELWEE